ncbi:MAG: tryptophan synthase subunit alpha [Thermodesulfovibrionia bacterium]|nr:tryptophan synthase subunit alpha [Thermodesulfovibrionia bacterium]
MSNISQVFDKLKTSGRKALIPYIMAGDPTLSATKKYISVLEQAGADIIELGVPFSDPLADGPTIQRAAERAIKHKVTLRKVLKLVSEIRKSTDIPIILMTYYNPVFKFGVSSFVKAAVKAGVDGVIVPDLIPDEADEYIKESRKYKLDTIFLLAPTSTPDRIKKIANASTGFIYYVSITGITGSKLSAGPKMKQTLRSIKKATKKPVAVGFGISTPEEAASMSLLADGVIVGSAIVKLISEGKDISSFVRILRKAI